MCPRLSPARVRALLNMIVISERWLFGFSRWYKKEKCLNPCQWAFEFIYIYTGRTGRSLCLRRRPRVRSNSMSIFASWLEKILFWADWLTIFGLTDTSLANFPVVLSCLTLSGELYMRKLSFFHWLAKILAKNINNIIGNDEEYYNFVSFRIVSQYHYI